jgi:hypothetical protein
MRTYVCVCVCVSVDLAPYKHTNKSQLKVTNQKIAHTFSSPNDLKKSYNTAARPRITVCDPKHNT